MTDCRLAGVFGRRMPYAALAVMLPCAAVAAPPVLDRAAVPDAPPPARAMTPDTPTTCTATGTFNEGGAALGSGTWTRTPKTKCRTPGNWTDQFGYSWVLRKDGHGHVGGTVNYHHIACEYDKWPVSGHFHGLTFSVTATNPKTGGYCAKYFGYVMTIN